MTTNQVFEAEGLKVSYGDWAKHHDKVGILCHSYVNDAPEPLPEKIQTLKETGAVTLVDSPFHFYDEKQSTTVPGTQVFALVKKNIAPPISLYETGASNTETDIAIRFKFLFEDRIFWLDYSVTYADSFNVLSIVEDLNNIIEEVAAHGNIETYGIELDDDEEDYNVFTVHAVTGEISPLECISMSEMLECFIGFDVYKSELTIKEW